MFHLSKNRLLASLRFAVVSSVVTIALVLPGLSFLGLKVFYTQSLVPALLLVLFYSFTRGLKPVVRLSLRFLAFVSFLFTHGIVQTLPEIFKVVFSGSALQGTVMLFSDILLPFWGVICAILGLLLTNGEPSFSIAILMTASMTMYLANPHAQTMDYWPAALSFPLLLSHANDEQELPEANQRETENKPWILLIAFLMTFLAIIFSPSRPVTNPTLKKQAADIRQWMNDTFFFTDQREAFSLKTLGWQPMEDGLGGKPKPINVPLLEIKGEGSVYLRGTIKDHYTGRKWYDSISDQRYSYRSLRFSSMRDETFDAAWPVDSLRTQSQSVNVHVLRQGASTLLLPQRVRELTLSERMVPYFNLASELFITRNIEPGDAYTVKYENYLASSEVLELAKKTEGTPPLSEDAYLQLPTHLTGENIVLDLANEIVAGTQTPYEKAAAIQRYLQTHYRFTENVMDAPTDTDFVAHFLFETKQGYCTYFASSMTILSRMAGLPARYVEGFHGIMELNQPTVLTGLDAHAWTEVNIPGLGWITFDATAPEEDQGDSPQGSGENEQDTPSPSPEQSPPPDNQNQPSSSPQTPTPPPNDPIASPTPPPAPKVDSGTEPDSLDSFLWWLWLLLLALILRWLWVSPTVRSLMTRETNAILRLWYTGCLDAIMAAGQKPNPSETMIEFAYRTQSYDSRWLEFSRVVSAMQYGKAQTTYTDIALGRSLYQGLYRKLSLIRKILLHLKRLFPKRVKGFKSLKNLRKK